MKQEYKYLGDKMTRPELKGSLCCAIRRSDGKCVRGRNANMLVLFKSGPGQTEASGIRAVVLARLLRKTHE